MFVHAPWHPCVVRRITWRSWFSLAGSRFGTSALIHWAIFLALFFFKIYFDFYFVCFSVVESQSHVAPRWYKLGCVAQAGFQFLMLLPQISSSRHLDLRWEGEFFFFLTFICSYFRLNLFLCHKCFFSFLLGYLLLLHKLLFWLWNNLSLFSEDHLDVAWGAHVQANPAMSSLSLSLHLRFFFHLGMFNDQRAYI